MNASSSRQQLGPIAVGVAYPRAVFLRLSGLTRSSFSAACRSGLICRRVGKRCYILGADWIEFLKASGDIERGSQL